MNKMLFTKWMKSVGCISPVTFDEMEGVGKNLDDVLYEFESWLDINGYLVEESICAAE